jgi:putative transposase
MPEYRRFRVEGGIYFFTVVTYHRRPILVDPTARRLLHTAWEDTKCRFPFDTIAICLLPDHIHCIWKLPEGDANYSIRWKEIKYQFTVAYLTEVGPDAERNESRQKRQEAAIWQRRFWEHTIESEEDFENHFDYIHYNPSNMD